mmetsp:Transcript_59860/g.106441  ORF Transcript_59860/g.106441 Transcript_59860/m.106441 type:complete len:219 (+) Transcript_59860:109-765(+)
MEPMTLVSPYFNQHAAAPDEPLYVFPSWLELAAKAPPGLAPPSDASKEDVHSSTNTKKICYFQNRYHHAAPGSSFVACSRGDDCDFCHCFHPKMKRRNDPTESFCNCSSSSSTASTEDGASESTAIETGADTSDDSSSVSSGSDDSPGLSLPPDVPTPTVVRVREGRQICYFQNRFYHPKLGKTFDPCSKGDECGCCHEMHPRIARRNDKTSRCNCPA